MDAITKYELEHNNSTVELCTIYLGMHGLPVQGKPGVCFTRILQEDVAVESADAWIKAWTEINA